MNIRSYAVYGIEYDDIEIGRTIVEALLNIIMVGRESMYRGEYYRSKSVGQEKFVLQSNYNYFEEEWTESKFTKFPLLLYVSETLRSGEITSLLQSDERIMLLKSKQL